MEQYLPAVIAVIGVAITAYVNYRLGKLKSSTESQDSLRDDILTLVDKYEAREKQYDVREKYLLEMIDRQSVQIQTLQETIATLRYEINELRIENRSLKAELQNTRVELEKFEKKVFYVPDQKIDKES